MKDAVKGLHTGLSRLADQITQNANQSASQVSSLASNLEAVAGKLNEARQDAEGTAQTLEHRIMTLDDRIYAVEKSAQTSAAALERALEALQARTREDAEAASDLAALETDLDERGGLEDVEPVMVRVDDVGELYGVHTPVALDRDIPDGDTSFEVGENWIESLQASATEFGPEPEEDLDVEDDADVPPHPSDRRDTPVADHGAAGRRGL